MKRGELRCQRGGQAHPRCYLAAATNRWPPPFWVILWVGGLLSVALLIPASLTSEPFMMVGSAWAAQVDPDQWVLNCSAWNGIKNPEDVKLAYVHGYLQAIQAVADKLRNDAIISDLWPIGHRVVSVALEIDLYCQRAENRNVSVWELIQQMAREKSKMNR